MTYFSRRNKHVVEYSGHEDASPALRERILALMQRHVVNNFSFDGADPWSIEPKDFLHEVRKEFPGQSPAHLVEHGQFHEVFTVVEILLAMAQDIDFQQRAQLVRGVAEAFDLSGAVYEIQERRVAFRVSEDSAKKIEAARTALIDNQDALERFSDAVGSFLGRKDSPENVVKNVFIAFENYLKDKTRKKEYGAAAKELQKNGVVSATQKALLDKIYAYRSDTDGVGHAGNGPPPGEIDALWFIETVAAQLSLIDRKLKQHDQAA